MVVPRFSFAVIQNGASPFPGPKPSACPGVICFLGVTGGSGGVPCYYAVELTGANGEKDVVEHGFEILHKSAFQDM